MYVFMSSVYNDSLDFSMSTLSSGFELVLKHHGMRHLNAVDLIAVRLRILNAFESLVFTFTLFSGMIVLQFSQNYSEDKYNKD